MTECNCEVDLNVLVFNGFLKSNRVCTSTQGGANAIE